MANLNTIQDLIGKTRRMLDMIEQKVTEQDTYNRETFDLRMLRPKLDRLDRLEERILNLEESKNA